MDDEIITATEASRSFSDLLSRVAYNGQSFLITKGNKLMARVIPVEEAPKAVKHKEKHSGEPESHSQPAESTANVNKNTTAPAKNLTEKPTEKSDYYKTVLGEMNKLLGE